jgi:hypothetical protein
MKPKLFSTAGFVFSWIATTAAAAPLCIEREGIPPQCLYVDPAACQADANRIGGQCAVNTEAPPMLTGTAAFCLIEPGLIASCIYPDRADCGTEATRRGGTCVENYPASPFPMEDPYKEKRDY